MSIRSSGSPTDQQAGAPGWQEPAKTCGRSSRPYATTTVTPPRRHAILRLPLGLVQAAISYYGAYRDEIDQWIEANEQQLAEAHAAWSAGQDAVRQ